jgi:hypothetical protein
LEKAIAFVENQSLYAQDFGSSCRMLPPNTGGRVPRGFAVSQIHKQNAKTRRDQLGSGAGCAPNAITSMDMNQLTSGANPHGQRLVAPTLPLGFAE